MFLDEIPKTHTHRAEKYRLRELDLPDRAWMRPRPVRGAPEPSNHTFDVFGTRGWNSPYPDAESRPGSTPEL